MASQSEQHAEYACRKYPPLILVPVIEQTQHKEQERNCSEIHRSCGKWLRTPVELQVATDCVSIGASLLEQLVSIAAARLYSSRRRSAVIVWYDKVRQFLPAV